MPIRQLNPIRTRVHGRILGVVSNIVDDVGRFRADAQSAFRVQDVDEDCSWDTTSTGRSAGALGQGLGLSVGGVREPHWGWERADGGGWGRHHPGEETSLRIRRTLRRSRVVVLAPCSRLWNGDTVSVGVSSVEEALLISHDKMWNVEEGERV